MIVNIFVALLLMLNVESSYNNETNEQITGVKKAVKIIRVINGIK